MKIVNKMVMTLAGLFLVVAAALKFQQLLMTCTVPSWHENPYGFWESYEFFLIQIPLEFALGVWLISGLFRKAAWIAGTLAYFGFIFVTIFKVVTGAESCGCFGAITVNPMITLFAIDVPFFLLLAIFWPRGCKLLPPPWPNLFYLVAVFVPTIAVIVLSAPVLVAFKPDCIKAEDTQPKEDARLKLELHQLKQDLARQKQISDLIEQKLAELQQAPRSTDTKAYIGVLEIIAAEKPNFYEIRIGDKQTLYINAENIDKIMLSIRDMGRQEFTITEAGQAQLSWIKPEPVEAAAPAEDKTAQGTEETAPPAVEKWDWLQYVVEDDVRQQISEGLVIVLMHRHDCPTCAEIVPAYSEYYREMTDQGVSEFKIAFLAVPPYHEDTDTVPDDTTCILGKLTDQQQWQLMSPYVVALLDGELVKTWEQGTAPEAEKILDEIFGQ